MMKTAINFLSVIPMRKEPTHRSELVSQLLFGEFAEVLEEDKDFVRIKCIYDNYEGWVQANQLNDIDQSVSTDMYIASWSQDVSINGQIIHASVCSPIYASNGGTIRFGSREIQYLATNTEVFWNCTEKIFNSENLKFIYRKFLNTPYLWGGKSVFGIDCSGFVQQVFKMFGVKLLRDAYLQAGQGTQVENIEKIALGDLAFFHNESGRVVHVGIILENNQIVHASGKVRIDTIDAQGILNNESGKRTHQLHSIKRM